MQSWMDAIMKNARSYDSVSAPLAVQHKVHGGFDGEKGFTVRCPITSPQRARWHTMRNTELLTYGMPSPFCPLQR
jgi:hypothetical protein